MLQFAASPFVYVDGGPANMSETATPNAVTTREGGLALTFTLTAFLAILAAARAGDMAYQKVNARLRQQPRWLTEMDDDLPVGRG
jgi:hypothetical protein